MTTRHAIAAIDERAPASIAQPHDARPAAVWSTGGGDYDEISRGMADALGHCALRLAPAPGERILDLATGTGWTSRLLARRGASVVGIDIAGALVLAARRRARAERLHIRYEIGDAESLPFADGAFDAVISTFGVMFARRPEAAAAELARVCRRGGRLALATWPPDGHVAGMVRVMTAYMPPSHPAPSPFEWGRLERLHALLGEAFDLRFEPGTSCYREPSPEAAWENFSTGYGPTRALAESLGPEQRAALARDFIAFHARFTTALGICVPREYWLTIGARR